MTMTYYLTQDRWNTRKASHVERFSDMFTKFIGLFVSWKRIDCGLVRVIIIKS